MELKCKIKIPPGVQLWIHGNVKASLGTVVETCTLVRAATYETTRDDTRAVAVVPYLRFC